MAKLKQAGVQGVHELMASNLDLHVSGRQEMTRGRAKKKHGKFSIVG